MLTGKALKEHLALEIELHTRQGYEHIRNSKIAVELRDLVLQDCVVPKRVPGQLIDHPVILVQIVATVCEDQIWREALERFEVAFECRAVVREVTPPELLDRHHHV